MNILKRYMDKKELAIAFPWENTRKTMSSLKQLF